MKETCAKGGFVGIALAILYAGGLPILSVAGAQSAESEHHIFHLRCCDRVAWRAARDVDVLSVRDRFHSVGMLLRVDRGQ